jgi:hypothetical protein
MTHSHSFDLSHGAEMALSCAIAAVYGFARAWGYVAHLRGTSTRPADLPRVEIRERTLN